MAVNDEVCMYLTASTLGHEVGAKQECICLQDPSSEEDQGHHLTDPFTP